MLQESRFEAGSAHSAHTVHAQSNGAAALTAPGLRDRRSVRLPLAVRADGVAKRALDILVAVVALVLLAPLILLVALLVRIDSHGPAFFAAPRIGHGGRDLLMLKFRKMHDRARGIPLTVDDDSRFTRVGAILARFKLDELPQFWHVLRGEMSLVGPRPETVDFVGHHRDAYHEILRVRPGVFGFSQIAFVAEGADPRRRGPDEPLHRRHPAAEGQARPHVRAAAHARARREDRRSGRSSPCCCAGRSPSTGRPAG